MIFQNKEVAVIERFILSSTISITATHSQLLNDQGNKYR